MIAAEIASVNHNKTPRRLKPIASDRQKNLVCDALRLVLGVEK